MFIESNTQKFMEFIFKYPTQGFSIREIAKKINISPPTVSIIAKKMEKKGLIIIKKENVQFKIFGNVENEKFKEIKRIYNLFSLIPLKNFLVKELTPNLIVVYGSYSRGEDIENSDIDIFVDTIRKKQINFTKFEKILGRKIHLVIEKFENLPKELKRNIINGVILYGVIEI